MRRHSIALVNAVLSLALAVTSWPAAQPAQADDAPPATPAAEASATPEAALPTEPPATAAADPATTPVADLPTEPPPVASEAGPAATADPTETPLPTETAGQSTETVWPPSPTATATRSASEAWPSETPSAAATETVPDPPTASVPPPAAPIFLLAEPPVFTPLVELVCASITAPPSTSVIISQVYGGGGNAGAPYRHDFVELYNLGATVINLNGWTVQYATATGSAWQTAALAGTLAPSDFWLIQLSSGGAAGADLPAPDQGAALNLSAAAGKVALVNGSAPLTGVCPTDPALVDFLGYGATANCAEGAPLLGLGNATAALRAALADGNQNAADFSAAAPTPRHSFQAGLPSATPTLPLEPSATVSASPSATPTPTPTLTPTPTAPARPAFPGAVLINEVVTDPQQDWSGADFDLAPGAGPVGDPDELVELLIQADGLDLTGWQLALLDGSEVTGDLSETGAFQTVRYVGGGAFTATRAGDRLVLGNVRGSGSMTNAVQVVLSDSAGNVIDRVALGGDAPAGNATGSQDEAIARRPDGQAVWVRQAATPGRSNDAAPLPELMTPSPTPTLNLTGSPTPTATLAPIYAPGSVLINEVAWAGTAASSTDEWLELYNPGRVDIPLGGWTLSDDGDLHLSFPAGQLIPAGGYLLLERTDDAAVSDIPADLLYAGGLSNTGETLTLRDASGAVIDVAAGAGGWPAGDADTRASMERVGGGWRTHAGAAQGRDARGAPIAGTPRGPNSALLPPPTPLPFTHTLLLNEFLSNPGEGGQEFIELINTGSAPVDLSGWQLDDRAGGSAPFTVPAGTVLAPGALMVFFKDASGLALNNAGDSVRLLTPDGQTADTLTYAGRSHANVSWARVPDGGPWTELGIPSPGDANRAGEPPSDDSTAAATAALVPIGTLRTWPVGAWATITGRVTAPAGLFGARAIYLQDETGGLAVYLGRGDWPALTPGQSVSALGYTRLRGGALELYVRNPYLVGVAAPDGQTCPPLPAVAAEAAEAGQLVTMTGRVVKLEGSAFWLEAGAGPVRVFFASSTGLRRPKVARGDTWTVTGLVTALTATKTRAAGYQLQPRFASDVLPIHARYLPDSRTPAETPP